MSVLSMSRQDFSIFAFMSVLLVPTALRQMRTVFRHEKFRQKFSERAARIHQDSRRRHIQEAEFQKILNRLCQLAEDTWWFPNATANNISSKLPAFRSPNWTGEPRPPEAQSVEPVTREFEESTVKSLLGYGFHPQWLGLQPFTIGGPISDYEKEQRIRKLLIVLNSSKSRMSTAMSNAVFEVLVDGTKLGQAASSRGLKPRSLSMTILRVTDRLRNLPKTA